MKRLTFIPAILFMFVSAYAQDHRLHGTESLRWGWADGFMQGETSTISVGMLWIDLYDPAKKTASLARRCQQDN